VIGRALALALALGLMATTPAGALERVRGVVHVHSDLTTGDFTLEALVGLADQQGIGALLLSENYLLRVAYDVPPFRALTRVVQQERSIGAAPERYLAQNAEAQRRLPHVLLIPGVEVMPHYFWTGSPAALDLTVHNLQKNILVFGVTDPAALRTLPVPGNRPAGQYTIQSVADALPVLLLVPGVVLLLRRRNVRRRLGRGAVIVVRRRAWVRGGLCCAIGLAALVGGWPVTTDTYSTMSDTRIAPDQARIDRVEQLGGATIWSFPEARDIGEQHYGPIRVARLTEPYPDDLLKTFRYTAFGAVYEDTSTFERPGGGWDRLLGEYVRGERSRPAWAIAESGFHGLTAGKQVGPLQTVFLVEEKSEAGILEALRRGRMYAVQRTRELGFDLTQFTVSGGGASAGAGETLRVPAGTPIELTLAIDASDGRANDVRIGIIVNGRAVTLERGATPYRTVYRTTTDGTPLVLRMEARGSQQRVLSNPIFVRAGS
jgi:hypothetical protein